MSYKQKTSYLGIPVLGKGDGIDGKTEMRKWRIVENMLVAGTHGHTDVTFQDGEFSMSWNGQKASVRLDPSGTRPAVSGLADGAYVMRRDALVWDDLEGGFLHRLYVRATQRTWEFPEEVVAESSVSDRGRHMLVATLDLRNGATKIDEDPPGKVYVGNIERHVLDQENPHGRILVQDEIVVRRRVVMPDGKSLGTFEKVDAESGGRDGTVVSFSKAVDHVSVQRTGSKGDERTLGECWIGYYGSDPDVPDEKTVVVYNVGEKSVPIRLLALRRGD